MLMTMNALAADVAVSSIPSNVSNTDRVLETARVEKLFREYLLTTYGEGLNGDVFDLVYKHAWLVTDNSYFDVENQVSKLVSFYLEVEHK